MDLFAPRHLIIILLVVLLVFGTKKLKTIGADLGAAVRGFKKSMSDAESEEQANTSVPQIGSAGSAESKSAEELARAAEKARSGPQA